MVDCNSISCQQLFHSMLTCPVNFKIDFSTHKCNNIEHDLGNSVLNRATSGEADTETTYLMAIGSQVSFNRRLYTNCVKS